MKTWVCSKCGHMVLANDKPSPIKWTDGHVCHFVEEKEEEEYKSGVYCSDCGKPMTEKEYSCGECFSCKGSVDCEENIIQGEKR